MKQEKTNQTNLNQAKSSKGITLIALVVTIIVLLILAGVTIGVLTGDNGILNKATEAKIQTGVGEEKEQITLAYHAAIIETNGEKINAQDLQSQINLNGVTATVEEAGENIKVTFANTGNNYWIDANGNIADTEPFSPETLEIGEAVNTDKYGWKVTNYTKKAIGPDGTNENSGEWRLFYQDSNCTYIIADDCIGSYMPSDYYSSYANGASVSTVGQRLSQKISSLFTESNTNENIRATAWLTDTEVWKSYKSDDALFAIGSPTAELFAASYNNRSNKSNQIELGLGTYGYTENTSSGWLSTSDNHGIYNKSTSSDWWLASPSGRDSGSYNNELYVYGNNGVFDSSYVGGNSKAVRPIVCIQTSVFNEKYMLADE